MNHGRLKCDYLQALYHILTNCECLTWLQPVGLARFGVALVVGRHHRHCVVLPALDVCHPALLTVGPAAGRLAVFLRDRSCVEPGPRRAAPRHHGDVGQAVHETANVSGRARLWKKRRRDLNNPGRTQSGGKKHSHKDCMNYITFLFI